MYLKVCDLLLLQTGKDILEILKMQMMRILKFGLSPIPDKEYKVYFYAFSAPTELSAHGDTIVLPDQYASVVTARTRYYVHQFKESLQQAVFALDDYKQGMKRMKSNLINPQPKNMTDDRISF
jgi:hypothetical protein